MEIDWPLGNSLVNCMNPTLKLNLSNHRPSYTLKKMCEE